jgi:tetratricopeptide (TPR) repeat protein
LRDKIEYYYRLGRIYDKLNKTSDALLNYQKAINIGKTSRYYYAANAALNIGRIYEEKHDFKKATEYYNQTIDIKDHDQKGSLDNEAKAGLKRVGG